MNSLVSRETFLFAESGIHVTRHVYAMSGEFFEPFELTERKTSLSVGNSARDEPGYHAGMTPREFASNRRERIKSNLKAAGELYAKAVIDRDWEALGMSFDAWHDDIMGPAKWVLEERVKIEHALADAAMPYREIGDAVGVSAATVSKDLSGVQPANTNPRQKAARKRESARPQARPKTARPGKTPDAGETRTERFATVSASVPPVAVTAIQLTDMYGDDDLRELAEMLFDWTDDRNDKDDILKEWRSR